ncbi:MAG: response regulator [Thermodesulfobacteriota bacterium]|jgi:CheY-like chemotaxis protein
MIPKKILLVDDDKELVYGMSVWLKSKGFQVLSATDATSAITLSKAEKPDLVILDIGLPGRDDYSTMARFKTLMPPAHIPMIVTTAGNASVHREKALQAGAEAFFQKPFDSRQLLAAIEEVLIDEPSEPPKKALNNTNQKKILIVDDNQDLLHALQVRLKSHGFRVHFTPDAALAIHIALKIKPDLVILDVDLPGEDGYSAMERLRSQMALAHVPIIIIAGEAPPHQDKALQAEAEAFFPKPIDHRQLLVAIHKALGEGESQA